MLDGLFFGTATQGEAARRRRPRGALREQEDEDAQGHDGQQATPQGAAPRRTTAQQFVRLKLCEQAVIGDRAGLRLRGEAGLRPGAARAARGRTPARRTGAVPSGVDGPTWAQRGGCL